MAGQIVRVVFGFVLASLAAGLALVLFVNSPADMPDWPNERFAETGVWALAVATQAGIFAAPFAFIGALYAEWRGITSVTYAVILGLLIAMIGFAAHYAGDASGDVSTYALSAFIVAGVVGGLVYWYVAGRYAVAATAPAPAADEPSPRSA